MSFLHLNYPITNWQHLWRVSHAWTGVVFDPAYFHIEYKSRPTLGNAGAIVALIGALERSSAEDGATADQQLTPKEVAHAVTALCLYCRESVNRQVAVVSRVQTISRFGNSADTDILPIRYCR